jgi:putative transposase
MMIERDNPRMPLAAQTQLLSLSRSSLYYKPIEPTPEEIAIKHRIDEIYTKYPFYGSRRITQQLGREGWLINRKAVQRHMREMGLYGITPGPNLSKRHQAHQVYPYLLRDVQIIGPDQVWGIDITYIRLTTGWMYLVAILDWFSRYVISWELDQTMEIDLVMNAVERALGRATPEIFNSDQGSQFTSPQYTQRLLQANIQISMDGKGRALDNIFTERLWRSVKYEEVYLYSYESPRQARQGLSRYLEFYNHERPHQSLKYQTPAEVYFSHQSDQTQSDNILLKGGKCTLKEAYFLS